MRPKRMLGVVWILCGMALYIPGESGAQVQVSVSADGGMIPDGSGNTTAGTPLDIRFDVPAGFGPVQTVFVAMTASHPAVGELVATLIAPDGTSHTLFGFTGWNGVDGALVAMGSTARLSGRYWFSDGATKTWWTEASQNVVMPQFDYRTSVPGGTPSPFRGDNTLMDPAFAGRISSGTWTLRIIDHRSGNTGNIVAPILSLQTALTDVQAPTSLKVHSIVGNLVTLRWDTPTLGPAPTGYVLQGGIVPGQVLGSIPMAEPQNSTAFSLGTGSYYVRVRAINGGMQSPVSNEIPLHVTTALPPSTPVGLTGLVDGSSVHLTWRNTYGGGIPTAGIVDVTGSATVSVPIGGGETFSYAGVPGGTYTFRVRGVNAGGSSSASNAVTLSFPRACGGATPGAPENFVAYALGRSLFLLWEAPSAGPAAANYLLHVTGAFTGDVPITGRGLSGPVPPGTYTFVLESGNTCGFGGFTPAKTVVVR